MNENLRRVLKFSWFWVALWALFSTASVASRLLDFGPWPIYWCAGAASVAGAAGGLSGLAFLLIPELVRELTTPASGPGH